MAIDNDTATETSETVTELQPVSTYPSQLNYLYIILILFAMGLSFFAIYENKQAQRLQKEQKIELNLLKQQSNHQNLQTDIKDLQTKFSSITEQMQTLQKQTSTKKPEWLLFKAKYYLELAQINSTWSTSSSVTLALLQQADELIKNVNQPEVVKIREALAEEILELKTMPQPDSTGILTQLSALQALIPSLEIKSADPAKQQTREKPNKTANWREKFQESLASLSHLVIIKEDSDRAFTLYSPRYAALVRENLRMDLKQAQWALTQKSEAAYQSSLAQALEDLTRGFSKNSKTTAFSKQLEELKSKQLGQDKINNINSLNLLTQYIDSFESKSSAEPKEENL